MNIITKELEIEIMKFFLNTSVPRIINERKSTNFKING